MRSLIYYFFLFYLFLFSNYYGKKQKMVKKRIVAIGWLQTICVIKFFACRRKIIFNYTFHVKRKFIGMRVLIVIFSAMRSATIDLCQLRWLVTRTSHSTKSYFSHLFIYNRQLLCGSYFGVMGCIG